MVLYALTLPSSLCAQAGEPPLRYPFLSLTAHFLASSAQFPQHPIFSNGFCHQNSLLLPLESRLAKRLKLVLTPSLFIHLPWLTSLPVIRPHLTGLHKTSNYIYGQHIKSIFSSDFPTHLLCFTDGVVLNQALKPVTFFQSTAKSQMIVPETLLQYLQLN